MFIYNKEKLKNIISIFSLILLCYFFNTEATSINWSHFIENPHNFHLVELALDTRENLYFSDDSKKTQFINDLPDLSENNSLYEATLKAYKLVMRESAPDPILIEVQGKEISSENLWNFVILCFDQYKTLLMVMKWSPEPDYLAQELSSMEKIETLKLQSSFSISPLAVGKLAITIKCII